MIDIRKDKVIVTKPAKTKRRAKKKTPVKTQVQSIPEEPRRTVENWLTRKKVSAPLAAALWRYTRWGLGRLVTEKQFDAALADLSTKPAREV